MKVLVFIAWLVSHEVCARYNISLVWWEKTPKTKNILLKRALSFDQWKKYSENYQPIRDRLRLVYKFTENYCRLRLFSKFIQTQKRYPTSLDKIRILPWKLLIIRCDKSWYHIIIIIIIITIIIIIITDLFIVDNLR